MPESKCDFLLAPRNSRKICLKHSLEAIEHLGVKVGSSESRKKVYRLLARDVTSRLACVVSSCLVTHFAQPLPGEQVRLAAKCVTQAASLLHMLNNLHPSLSLSLSFSDSLLCLCELVFGGSRNYFLTG